MQAAAPPQQATESPAEAPLCQLPDRNQYEEHRLVFRKKLQEYLQQQLQAAVPYTELQLRLPPQYLIDLHMAQLQLLTTQAKNPQPIATQNEALQQLQRSSGDLLTTVQHIKSSPLYDASFISPDGLLIPFTLKSMLLSVVGHDLTLLRKTLEDVELKASDYAIGLKHVSVDTLQLLLEKTESPADFRMQGMNLADIAVLNFRVDLLPLLAGFNIKPTEVPGHYSALDLAFSAPEQRIVAIKQGDKQQIVVDRQQTIRYLQQRGYVLHAALTEQDGAKVLTVDSIWDLTPVRQDNQFGQVIADPVRIKLAEQQQLEPILPVQIADEFSAFLQPLLQHDQQFDQAQQTCQQARDQARLAEGLWTEAQIRAAIQNALKTLISPITAAAALHQQDPALVERLWPTPKADLNIPALDQAGRERLIARLQGAGHPIRASRALKHLQQEPALAIHWQSQEVEHLSYLRSESNTVAFWRELIKHGFSLHLQDIHGRNLYPQAFAAGPDAVALLLTEGVAVDVPAVGPDALDLALDQSYRDQKLHPAVVTIMQNMGKPDASHFSRLRRLQQYQPIVFTALQQALAKEPTLLAWLDDLNRYEANPVLAVADD